MQYTELAIGVMIGILVGAMLLWLLDRRHQKVVKKLVESRRKIERQRTQAVNDLFALRAEIEDGTYQPAAMSQPHVAVDPDPQMVAEMANLRSLIARADGALTAARRKRDKQEAEIVRLQAALQEATSGKVIDLRSTDPRLADGRGHEGMAL